MPHSNEYEEFKKGIKDRRIKSMMQSIGESTGSPLPSVNDMPALPMAGVTRFVTGGIPDVARRVGATQQFLDAMNEMGSKASEAGELFAQRYPRVAAHIHPYELVGKAKNVLGLTSIGRRSALIPEKTPVGLKIGPKLEDTLLHEGTHVAQELGLGSGRLGDMYGRAAQAIESIPSISKHAYALNPFERSARSVASRKLGANLPPIKSLEELRNIVENLPPGSPDRIELAKLLMSR